MDDQVEQNNVISAPIDGHKCSLSRINESTLSYSTAKILKKALAKAETTEIGRKSLGSDGRTFLGINGVVIFLKQEGTLIVDKILSNNKKNSWVVNRKSV